MVIEYVPSRSEETRLGITVSKRFGKAHERNQFKRRLREAFRTTLHRLPKGYDLNIRPRGLAKTSSSQQIAKELCYLLQA